jgi:adenosine deaminase
MIGSPLKTLAAAGSLLLLSLAPATPVLSKSAPAPDAAASAKIDALRDKPAQLYAYLLKFPKGGELHNHLSGAVYAEDYLTWAGQKDLCIDTVNKAIAPAPCKGPKLVPARGLDSRDPALYQTIVDWISVRGWLNGTTNLSGYDAFFSVFDKFGAVAMYEHGKSIAIMRQVSADGSISYLELMNAPISMQMGMGAPGDPQFDPKDMEAAYARLKPALTAIADYGPKESEAADDEADKILGCGTNNAHPGCAVQTRYLCYALRTLPPAVVFRHLSQCFALSNADPRYVGINIVAPEHDPVAIRDYDLHMQMINFLAAKYPNVKISLHAGELTMGVTPTWSLRDHIEKAIDIGKANRIGHGVDMAFETNSAATLARMAKEEIAIEIQLTSNDVILGVKGGDHPISLYKAAGVPIVFSTDDEGVLRTDITEQYVRAVMEHNFSYPDLKKAARDSLHYAFIQGGSIWADKTGGAKVSACTLLQSESCKSFAGSSPKAALQVRLESELAAFEKAAAER